MNDDNAFNSAGDYDSEPVAQVSFIKRYVTFLKKWWWIPMFSALLALGGAGYYFHRLPPSYSSFSRMGVLGKTRLAEGGFYTDEPAFFFQTQIELMRSAQMNDRANARLESLTQGKKPPKVKLKISIVPKTTMLELEALGRDGTYTKSYLDAIMDEYLLYRRELRQLVSKNTLDSLTDQLTTQEQSLKEAQDRLNKFQQEHNDVVLQAQGASEATHLVTLKKEFADLSLQRDLLGLIALDRSASASNRVELLAPGTFKFKDDAQNNSPGSAPATDFVTARQRVQELKVQLEELSRNLRLAHPKVQKLVKEIELAEKNIQEYRKLNQEQTLAQRHDLELRMKGLDDKIVDWESKVMLTQFHLAENRKLEMHVTRELQILDNLKNVYRNVNFNEETDSEALTVIERASKSLPTDRRIPFFLFAALVGGMALGFGVIMLIERSDDRFTSLLELTQQFDEVIVGQVPELPRAQTRNGLVLLRPGDDRHVFAESNRNLRSSLLYMSTGERRPKTILVASAVPNEGKSTVAANLARTLAFGGARVLIVDADMRRGTQHQFLEMPAEPGLADYLRASCSLDDVIRETSLPNLFLVPRGKITNDAGELFLGSRMDHLLKTVYAQFDCVIFDSVPVFAADDTPTLAPKMDGVLFVVRGSFTRAKHAREAVELLRHRRVNILGLVFNRARPGSNDYYYYKYSEYNTAGKSASS
ncbi:MAG: polysaccharide biosynthesis tyrosine autokinase [Verrucomicrobia bacterium]|nr:polysaccharide biosynthesis tyrosine autokinase [Verrucomicrobiota bacterium]